MRLSPWLCVFALGCGDELSATMEVEPREGIAPLQVRLTASVPKRKDASKLRYRFDLDGDGTFDTEPSADPSVEHEYVGAGLHQPKVEVSVGKTTAIASVEITVRENQPPAAKLDATPLMGRQPLVVTLDASGSVDPDGEPNPLEARLDFEGDGTFDTEFSAIAPVTHTYSVHGTFTPKVEVRDWRGGLAQGSGPPVTILPGVDLDVDADRDGLITDADDGGEESFTVEAGAVFIANADDDDADGRQDWRDATLSGAEDLADLAGVLIPQYPELPADSTVTLSVSVADRVRIFLEDGPAVSELIAPADTSNTISPTLLANGDVHLFVEGISTRQPNWDGHIELTLTVERAGEAPESDTVMMRAAPVLFPDNLQEARILYVMKIDNFQLGPNPEFLAAIEANLPAGVALYTLDEFEYLGDRWVQDNMQTGYQAMPAEGGPHVIQTYLETVRPTGADGLEYFVTRERIGADYGFVYPGGQETSLNYGGNLEVTPAFSAGGVDHPYGRIMVGGGAGGTLMGRSYEDHMTAPQRAWLSAQMQGPAIELSTEWLVVGHLDEVLQFIPDPSRSDGRDFKVVFASPAVATASLERLEAGGMGTAPVFAGRREETTVSEILEDAQLMAYNEAAQARIDTFRELLMTEMELTDADIIEVPVLYEPIVFGGEDFAVAYNPGIQNLVTLRNRLLVPDPEGPAENGVDVWQQMTRDALEPLGLEVVFVDIYESYHVNWGEAHCGTEVEHASHSQVWWEKE